MSHQDWTTVTFNSSKKTPVVTSGTKTSANISALKIENIADESNAPLTISMMSSDAVKAIIAQRKVLNITQKELAAKCNILEATIRNIEQSKEPHNVAILNSLQRVLRVKLLGDNIGSAIETLYKRQQSK